MWLSGSGGGARSLSIWMVQLISREGAGFLREHDLEQEMSPRDDCHYNPVAQSFLNSEKVSSSDTEGTRRSKKHAAMSLNTLNCSTTPSTQI